MTWYERFGGSPASSDEPFGAAAREAVARLAELDAPGVAHLREALERGSKPDFPRVRELSRHLREAHPALARRLRGGADHAWAQIRNVAEQLAGAAASAFLTAAAETQTGDAGDDADSRYFAALEALLERVASLLRRMDGQHRVGVRALARDVVDPSIRRRMRLMPQHLGKVIQKFPSDEEGTVRLIPEYVVNYDESVDVPFVLADFFANRSRRALRQDSRDLAGVEAELAADLGVGVRSGQPGRSHLAATGECLEWLRASTGTERPSKEPLDWVSPRRRWAVEQAVEWADLG
jgi:hypothetical protein